MSSVTIGGQTFVKSGNGWIDKKTKQPAPEGLTTLLNNVAEEESPEGKRKRVRVDPGRPVIKLGSSEYVYDFNGKTWIDKKTKDPANPNFSRIIEGVFQGLDEWVGADGDIYDKSTLDAESLAKQKSEQAKSIVNNMGSTGQAGKQKVRKPTGGGQFAAPNIKINSPIVQMIEKLAVIDSYLKQRLDNQKMLAAKNTVAAKEQQIEAPQLDAQPEVDAEQIDAMVEEENKKSNAAMIAVAVGAAGLIASQFDPVREAFSSVIDFSKKVYGYFKGFMEISNSALESMNNAGIGSFIGQSFGLSESSESPGTSKNTGQASAETSSKASVPSSTRSDQTTQPSAATSVTTMGSSSQPSMATASPSTSSTPSPSTGEDIVVTAPRRSSSSGSSSSRSQSATPAPAPSAAAPSATPVAASPVTPNTPPTTSPDWLNNAPKGTVWQGKGFMVRKENDGTYSVRSPGSDWSTGESAENARYMIQSAGLNSSAGTQYNPSGVTMGADSVDGYISPVEGYPINSPYGMRKHPVTGGMKFHTGVDIAAPGGTPVRAVKSGTVTKISANQRPYSGFGNVVVIDHGDGYQTVYAHLSQFACKVGDRVQQGQVIGYVGSTGMSTGNHLHFIVQKTGHAVPTQGNTINPATLLREGGVTIPAGMEGYDSEPGSAAEGLLQSAGDLTKGAMEAIGTILRAGLGSQTATTGSQLSAVNDTMSGNIASAARERAAATAASRTQEAESMATSDPMNLNAPTGSSTVQNLPNSSDKAGVDFYLTRMGFPKISYKQNAYAGMRA
jgi:murein DD-endopeptidase MepM/ murein hydrolase activator NlpD